MLATALLSNGPCRFLLRRNFQTEWGEQSFFHYFSLCWHQLFDPNCWNKMSSPRSLLYWVHVSGWLQISFASLCQPPPVCSLSNWLRPQVNWTLSRRTNIEPGCISPLPLRHRAPSSRRAPLPCSGFHRPAPRPGPLFNTETYSTRDWWTKSMWEDDCILPCDWAHPLFIICVYIFSIKVFCCWWMFSVVVDRVEPEVLARRPTAYALHTKSTGNMLT